MFTKGIAKAYQVSLNVQTKQTRRTVGTAHKHKHPLPSIVEMGEIQCFLLETIKSFMEIHTIVQEELRMQYGNTLFINGKIHVLFRKLQNNISVLSWRSVLLVEETRGNHRPVASH